MQDILKHIIRLQASVDLGSATRIAALEERVPWLCSVGCGYNGIIQGEIDNIQYTWDIQ